MNKLLFILSNQINVCHYLIIYDILKKISCFYYFTFKKHYLDTHLLKC